MSKQKLISLPLQDKRILVTRPHEQAGALSEQLRTLGALPVVFPTIRIVPPVDWELLDSALARLFSVDATNIPYYTWLVFTSANGVNMCCERLQTLGYDLRQRGNVRIAAIGPATAAALARYSVTADLVPSEYIAEGVASALIKETRRRGESLQGKRILLPRAAEARNVLVTELQRVGAIVDEVAAYMTVSATTDDEQGRAVLHLLQTGQLDILTFTSSSTVRHFMSWLRESVPVNQNPSLTSNPRLRIASIGPITSQTARTLGLTVHIEAREFTIDGLIKAIVEASENDAVVH
jgi:uroporphyrinogen-III synthase